MLGKCFHWPADANNKLPLSRTGVTRDHLAALSTSEVAAVVGLAIVVAGYIYIAYTYYAYKVVVVVVVVVAAGVVAVVVVVVLLLLLLLVVVVVVVVVLVVVV